MTEAADEASKEASSTQTRHANRVAITVSDNYEYRLGTHCQDDSVTIVYRRQGC